MRDPVILLLLGLVLLALGYLIYKIRFTASTVESLLVEVKRAGVTSTRQTETMDRLLTLLKLRRGDLPPTRGWAASPDFLLILARHVLKERPETIVECGSGVSTLVLARCLEINGAGHLWSLDHSESYAKQTRDELGMLGLRERASVLHATIGKREIDGREWPWYSTGELAIKSVDMLVVDGPPETTGHLARYPAGPIFFPLLSPGGAVFLDDADREDEREIVRKWTRDFPAIESRMLICEKGCARLILNRRDE